MWNFYNYDGPCTNNCLERWHNWLKRIVKKPHQNIYEIIHVFKREQVLKDHMTDGDVSIKDSHIKEGTFELTTPKTISSNIQSCTIQQRERLLNYTLIQNEISSLP